MSCAQRCAFGHDIGMLIQDSFAQLLQPARAKHLLVVTAVAGHASRSVHKVLSCCTFVRKLLCHVLALQSSNLPTHSNAQMHQIIRTSARHTCRTVSNLQTAATMAHSPCRRVCRVPVDSPQRFRIELLFSPGASFNPYEVVPLHKDHTLPVQPRACLHKGGTALHIMLHLVGNVTLSCSSALSSCSASPLLQQASLLIKSQKR